MKFLLALLMAQAVAADKALKNPLPQGEVAEACQIDVKTHCGTEAKNTVQKCLHDHDKDLTPPCQAHINQKKAAKTDPLKGASPIDRAGAMFQGPGSN